MYKFSVTNQYGQEIELTNNERYSVKSILGLDPPDGVINTTRNAGQDGSVFNSAYMDNRTVTITLAIESPAEENRLELYKYFKIKQPVILHYTNGSRDVWIRGYTQSMPIAFFDKKETAQIVILCPEPYFNDVETVQQDLISIESLFEFPFEIESPVAFSRIVVGVEKSLINFGDVPIGFKVTIDALGAITNPVVYNTQTNEFIKLNDTLAAGDLVEISTVKGSKYIRKTSNGSTTSLIGKLAQGSTWIQLLPGDNVFATAATSGSEYIKASFEYTYQYEGV